MKSKAEIAQAIKKTCMFVDTICADCPYKGPPTCTDRVISDLRDILDDLSKSDFEAVKEILKRSKEVGYHHYTAISGIECLEIPFLRFDEEGNIL